MYGQYKEDLGEFARSHAQKLSKIAKRDERILSDKYYLPQLTGLFMVNCT